jgi:hypothetical protein
VIKPLVDFRNRIDFWLRQHIHWRRKGYHVPANSNRRLFSHLAGQDLDRAQHLSNRLVEKYHLQELANETKTGNFQENLFYLHMLEEGFTRGGITLDQSIKTVDIGPSHWFYVRSLHAFLTWYQTDSARNVQLDGFEVDAFRVYSDFYSRYDHALAHIGTLPGVTYHPQGFTTQSAEYDIAFLFFPFILEDDHLNWGLPSTLFQPESVIQSAWDSLSIGGRLFIVNQGSEEYQKQLDILASLGIPVQIHFQMDPLLFNYSLVRFITVSGPHE